MLLLAVVPAVVVVGELLLLLVLLAGFWKVYGFLQTFADCKSLT